MPVFLLIIALVLIVAAIRNTQGSLFSALMTDVPGFFVWGAAIFALAAIGWVPGLKPVSRGLLALVLMVIVLENYKNVVSSFTNLWQAPTSTASSVTDSAGNSPNLSFVAGSLADASAAFGGGIAGAGS